MCFRFEAVMTIKVNCFKVVPTRWPLLEQHSEEHTCVYLRISKIVYPDYDKKSSIIAQTCSLVLHLSGLGNPDNGNYLSTFQ